MPYIGLGIHVIVALCFAVHAVRTRQELFWLFILFSFPLLGSVVYFLAIYLPDSRLRHNAKQAVISAAKGLDPGRELREARAACEETPSAQNRMRLAAALLDAGQAEDAVTHYEACLSGPLADDPEIRFGAARAYVELQKFAPAIEQLERMRKTEPEYRAEEVSLLLARSLAQSGRRAQAQAEFESAVARFGSFDAKAEYLIWALVSGEKELAARLQAEVQRTTERWNRKTRELNHAMLRRLDAAYDYARQRT
jgi:hypothetical protein